MSLISKQEAKELNINFINSKSPAMDRISGKEDANAVWFSIQDLENLLENAKEQLSQEGKSIDGVRVYLGSYASDYSEKDLQDMTTVFVVTTSKNEDGLSVDYPEVVLNRGHVGYPPKKIFEI